MKYSRRVGKIVSTEENIDNIPHIIYHLQFVPVEASYSLALRQFFYTGMSPYFMEMHEGEEPPVYRPKIFVNDAGEWEVEIH